MSETDLGDTLAQYVIERRGYVVLGFTDLGRIEPGDAVEQFSGHATSQPLVIVSRTDRADWDEQNKVLSPRFKSDRRVRRLAPGEPEPAAEFFKAVTD